MGLFDEQISRKPDKYPWTREFINSMHHGFWTDAEFNFQSDVHDFKTKLTPEEQEVVVRALSAIGQIEVAVKTFWARLGDNLRHPSITDLGYVMANTEVIHNYAYERLLTVLGLEHKFEENLKLDIIKGRVDYLRKYNHKYYKDSKKQYVYALILFTLFIENVSLFSQFYIVNWFNRYRNSLKDCSQQVLYTQKEETIHALVGIKLIKTLQEEYPELFDEDLKTKILKEANEAFEAECQIVDWMLGDYKGKRISAEILKEYIKERINDSLEQIGYGKLYEIDPKLLRDFEWMNEEVMGNNQTDFFKRRPADYGRSNQSFDENDLFS